jgi:hypothetical protein
MTTINTKQILLVASILLVVISDSATKMVGSTASALFLHCNMEKNNQQSHCINLSKSTKLSELDSVSLPNFIGNEAFDNFFFLLKKIL